MGKLFETENCIFSEKFTVYQGPVLRIKINMLWITLLPVFTNPNNRNHDKRFHDGGYQLSNSTQIFPI